MVTTTHTLTALARRLTPAPLACVPDDQWGPLGQLYSEAPSLNGSRASCDFNAGISTCSFTFICCGPRGTSLLPFCPPHGVNGTEPPTSSRDQQPFALLHWAHRAGVRHDPMCLSWAVAQGWGGLQRRPRACWHGHTPGSSVVLLLEGRLTCSVKRTPRHAVQSRPSYLRLS